MKARVENNRAISVAEWARDRVRRNRKGQAVGFFSVCSAHPWVLESAMRQALADDSYVSIESTSNQVNQFGGYTGTTPAQFAEEIRSLAQKVGLPENKILLGGDHLGPYPWRKLPSKVAMTNACQLVRDCVLAGYQKIHLDASMACADDPPHISEDLIAHRASLLCQAAEEAGQQSSSSVMYVIGTEVPTPGGEQADDSGLRPTNPTHVQSTLEISRKHFFDLGLRDAWERVIALVVQPGVEFGDATVHGYDRKSARALAQNLPKFPELVYEAHSTDYQASVALRELVGDHFAILKVGPWLTFAMREAIFALGEIERNWLGSRDGIQLSNVRRILDQAMLANPEHWKAYYSGDEEHLKFARSFSFSDRCRYYWFVPTVQSELQRLVENLSKEPIPLTLLSQFMPRQYEKVRNGEMRAVPELLIQDAVRDVCRVYGNATNLRG
jgi:D-tagatose-1,6-bisphosphate aldolase subunit GatZ/KbaZ